MCQQTASALPDSSRPFAASIHLLWTFPFPFASLSFPSTSFLSRISRQLLLGQERGLCNHRLHEHWRLHAFALRGQTLGSEKKIKGERTSRARDWSLGERRRPCQALWCCCCPCWCSPQEVMPEEWGKEGSAIRWGTLFDFLFRFGRMWISVHVAQTVSQSKSGWKLKAPQDKTGSVAEACFTPQSGFRTEVRHWSSGAEAFS